MDNINNNTAFEAGKQWATDHIDDVGFSGIDDLYLDLNESTVIESYTPAFSDGVSVVGMEAEAESLGDYIGMEEVASYRATHWSEHNDDYDVSGQVSYREDNISEAESEINDLRTEAVLIEAKYG